AAFSRRCLKAADQAPSGRARPRGRGACGWRCRCKASPSAACSPAARSSAGPGRPLARHLVPILTMCLVVAITWVESIGDTIVVGDMVGRKPTAGTISDLLRADGLATLLGGVLNSFPY